MDLVQELRECRPPLGANRYSPEFYIRRQIPVVDRRDRDPMWDPMSDRDTKPSGPAGISRYAARIDRQKVPLARVVVLEARLAGDTISILIGRPVVGLQSYNSGRAPCCMRCRYQGTGDGSEHIGSGKTFVFVETVSDLFRQPNYYTEDSAEPRRCVGTEARPLEDSGADSRSSVADCRVNQ